MGIPSQVPRPAMDKGRVRNVAKETVGSNEVGGRWGDEGRGGLK